MAVSPSFRTFVLDQLRRVRTDVRARSMFGGVGIHAGELFFALIADDTVYFKVDDSNRDDYLERGLGPFHPHGPDGESMGYYEVPGDLLEDAATLQHWMDKAVAVAAARRKRSPSRSGGGVGSRRRGRGGS